jgi:2',3'-cyclic-nucleotide 2'-phosphodiesterase/3'-nucleotidase
LARYSTALKEARKNGDVLALDNGDILQGSPLLTYFHKTLRKPHLLSEVMNLIGIDVFNLGNHDFNYGSAILNQFLSDLKAPCLTSNILQHGKPFGVSHLIDWEGHKIALIGSCTDYIPHWEQPANIAGMTFLDPITIITQEVNRLRAQADVVIVLYHGGLERDPLTGQPTEPLTGENMGYALAQIPGIDLLITGHQHRSIITTIHKTLITQCAYNAKEFAKVELSFDPELTLSAQLITMKDYPEDQAVLDLIKPYQDQTEVWLDQPITTLYDYDFRIRDPFEARLHKHPLVSLINMIQLERSGAQLSGTSLFNDPIGFNPNVTTRDVVSTYIYPNTLVVKEINGIRLKAYLEKCAEYFIVSNGVIKVNPEYDSPKAQHFNYDMVDGIAYTLTISNPVGQRVTELSYLGKPIQPDEVFSLVINNYRSSGGGNFTMITDCPTLSEINTDMTDILIQYLESHPKLKLSHQNNINVTL